MTDPKPEDIEILPESRNILIHRQEPQTAEALKKRIIEALEFYDSKDEIEDLMNS